MRSRVCLSALQGLVVRHHERNPTRTFPEFSLSRLLKTVFEPKPGQRIGILIDLADPKQIDGLRLSEGRRADHSAPRPRRVLPRPEERGHGGTGSCAAARCSPTRSPAAATWTCPTPPGLPRDARSASRKTFIRTSTFSSASRRIRPPRRSRRSRSSSDFAGRRCTESTPSSSAPGWPWTTTRSADRPRSCAWR